MDPRVLWIGPHHRSIPSPRWRGPYPSIEAFDSLHRVDRSARPTRAPSRSQRTPTPSIGRTHSMEWTSLRARIARHHDRVDPPTLSTAHAHSSCGRAHSCVARTLPIVWTSPHDRGDAIHPSRYCSHSSEARTQPAVASVHPSEARGDRPVGRAHPTCRRAQPSRGIGRPRGTRGARGGATRVRGKIDLCHLPLGLERRPKWQEVTEEDDGDRATPEEEAHRVPSGARGTYGTHVVDVGDVRCMLPPSDRGRDAW
jgi:hypothetical protein